MPLLLTAVALLSSPRPAPRSTKPVAGVHENACCLSAPPDSLTVMSPATWPLSAMATAWDSAPRSAVSAKEAAAARGADAARKMDATAKTTTPSRSLITPGPKPQSPPLFDSRTCKPTRAAKKSSAAGPTPRPRSVVRFCHQVAGALDEKQQSRLDRRLPCKAVAAIESDRDNDAVPRCVRAPPGSNTVPPS